MKQMVIRGIQCAGYIQIGNGADGTTEMRFIDILRWIIWFDTLLEYAKDEEDVELDTDDLL